MERTDSQGFQTNRENDGPLGWFGGGGGGDDDDMMLVECSSVNSLSVGPISGSLLIVDGSSALVGSLFLLFLLLLPDQSSIQGRFIRRPDKTPSLRPSHNFTQSSDSHSDSTGSKERRNIKQTEIRIHPYTTLRLLPSSTAFSSEVRTQF
ncbi:hypothetical protein PGT21_005173 [Puccinia graminis f. sp. tritici]|uniref:Uncharacterized protein n=1 Tax=Puccinia graminis f. sp. tritici TaxID=56615 RepID=A0A5B0M2L0_PUCGR|nr:hypothetical protein PGT21_005173 [Puccinia graminis f. sp. tritici]